MFGWAQIVPLYTVVFFFLSHFLILLLMFVSVESVGMRSKLLRKVEELKSELVCSDVPDEFLCPITRELMREPVIAAGKLWSELFHLLKCMRQGVLPLQEPTGHFLLAHSEALSQEDILRCVLFLINQRSLVLALHCAINHSNLQ